MVQTWIVVADGSHARLFQTADPAQPWSLLRKVEREHSREKTNRSDSHEDRGEHEFARTLVGELETGRQAGSFARLVLVAPPSFLGMLRGELPAPLATCVAKSLDKDFSHVADGELHSHIDIA